VVLHIEPQGIEIRMGGRTGVDRGDALEGTHPVHRRTGNNTARSQGVENLVVSPQDDHRSLGYPEAGLTLGAHLADHGTFGQHHG